MIETGNRNFWIAQGIGWGLIAFSNFIVQYLAGLPLETLLLNSVAPFSIGFIVTTLFRNFIKKYNWKQWPLSKMILLILGSTIFQTTILLGLLLGVIAYFLGIGEMDTPRILSNFFIFGFILLTWNLVYFIIHYFNNWHNSEIEKWKLAAEMKDAQLGSLKSQINPHFIFNAINNIRSLILEDKEKARDMLLNFSDLFRYSLKHTDNSTVKLQEEIEVVEQYLELLSIQFEHKLQYELNVDEDLKEMEIPPMILQILIENAVKHGISQNKEGGIIQIDIHQANDFFFLDVRNSGSLKTTTSLGEKLGVGLENIKKRLELIYNGKANFQMSDNNNFVTASIKIPIL